MSATASSAGWCDSGSVRPTGVTSSGAVDADAELDSEGFAAAVRAAAGRFVATGFRATGFFAAVLAEEFAAAESARSEFTAAEFTAVSASGTDVVETASAISGVFLATGFLAAGFLAAGLAAGFAAGDVVDVVDAGFADADVVDAAFAVAGRDVADCAEADCAPAGLRAVDGRLATDFATAGFTADSVFPGAASEARSSLVGLSGSGVGGKEVTKQTYQGATPCVADALANAGTCENAPWSVTNWTRRSL